jgi:cytochrome b
MQRVLIWDFSTRVLHLAFAGGIAVALGLGFAVDDEHPLFAYHMLAGLFAGGALVVRLALGVVGPRHTRFRDWPLGAGTLVRFLRDFLRGRERAEHGHAGHNPLAAWVMLGMFGAALGLAITGLRGGEDLHEGLAWAMVVLIGAHLGGIAFHSWRARENLALAMVDGRKRAVAGEALGAAGWLRGALVCAVLAGWAGVLWRGFDAVSGTLVLPGLASPLRVGEGEGRGEGREREGSRSGRHGESEN